MEEVWDSEEVAKKYYEHIMKFDYEKRERRREEYARSMESLLVYFLEEREGNMDLDGKKLDN